MKICSKCKQEKDYEDFYLNASRSDGLTSWCRACTKTYQKRIPSEKRAEWSARHYQKKKEENPALFMWKQAKHRAKWDYNDMEFSIEVSDIVIPLVCPYFNVPFIPLDRNWGYSLDRIDSSKGYIKGNIQVISSRANTMKNNATKEELIQFAEGVLRLHSQEGKACAR